MAQEAQQKARRVVLVGAGVVGRSIAAAHLAAGVSVEMVDTSADVLESASAYLHRAGFETAMQGPFAAGGLVLAAVPQGAPCGAPAVAPLLVIESIVERRDPKRALLAEMHRHFGDSMIFATNTSSLRLADLESATGTPEQFCGLHFFMPVERRPMVEVVCGAHTSRATLAEVEAHVHRIGKQPLRVADGPGFVVNRMLSPYLNQAMLLLGSGADPRSIGSMAEKFGMPFSPLYLVDLIGARTAFDAGRAFWQAFPGRIDPAPVLPGMIKAGLGGRAGGCGFYEYEDASETGPQSLAEAPRVELSPCAREVIDRYRRDERDWSAGEIYDQLSLPMLIEAACLLRDGIVRSPEDIETAMRGGLDFANGAGFFGSFDQSGGHHLAERLEKLGPRYKALSAPREFLDSLRTHDRTADAAAAFARVS